MGTMVNLDLFLHRAKNRLFSRQSWVVLSRLLSACQGQMTANDIEVREAREDELDAVARVLPDELAGRLSYDKRLAMVKGRFRSGMPCILAIGVGSGKIVGGCWCRSVSPENPLRQLLPEWRDVFEISTLFVAPDCRGMNLGAVLVDQACSIMREKGYQGCVSLVWYTRPASVKVHLKVGFQPVGEKVTFSVFGIRRSRIHSAYCLERLPQADKVAS